MAETGAYLIIRSYAPDGLTTAFARALGDKHEIAGSARIHEVEVFEPGSIPAHTFILPFASKEEARTAYSSMPDRLISQSRPPLVLLCNAVPPEGFEDAAIPTKANVEPSEYDNPVLMMIEGTATDQDRMDQYRNILLPMMFELKSYYIAFDLGGDVEVLSGKWDEAIFAISRWSSRDSARQFWLSRKYQYEGIPLRLDIGRFEVVIIPETND